MEAAAAPGVRRGEAWGRQEVKLPPLRSGGGRDGGSGTTMAPELSPPLLSQPVSKQLTPSYEVLSCCVYNTLFEL